MTKKALMLISAAITALVVSGCGSANEDKDYNPDKDKDRAGQFQQAGSDNAPKAPEPATSSAEPIN